MKKRLVFKVDDIRDAQSAMDEARVAGIEDEDISLVAPSSKSDLIPDERKTADGDVYAGAAKGAATGTAVGLVAGLAAVAIPPLGITVAGALAAVAVVGGGVLGAWSTTLTGRTSTDAVGRTFEEEVDAGHILVVIDGNQGTLERAATSIKATGATQLDFERAAALS